MQVCNAGIKCRSAPFTVTVPVCSSNCLFKGPCSLFDYLQPEHPPQKAALATWQGRHRGTGGRIFKSEPRGFKCQKVLQGLVLMHAPTLSEMEIGCPFSELNMTRLVEGKTRHLLQLLVHETPLTLFVEAAGSRLPGPDHQLLSGQIELTSSGRAMLGEPSWPVEAIDARKRLARSSGDGSVGEPTLALGCPLGRLRWRLLGSSTWGAWLGLINLRGGDCDSPPQLQRRLGHSWHLYAHEYGLQG